MLIFCCNRHFPLAFKHRVTCHLLALLGAHPILHFSRMRVNPSLQAVHRLGMGLRSQKNFLPPATRYFTESPSTSLLSAVICYCAAGVYSLTEAST